MAVIDYRRIGEREHSMELSSNGTVIRRYTLRFRAITDSGTDSPGLVRQHPLTPRLGTILQDIDGFVDLVARCKRVNVDEDGDDDRFYIVTAEYDTEPYRPEQPENPLQWESEIKLTWDQQKFAIDRDVMTGEAITNAAGDSPEPPQEVDVALGRFTIVRNEPLITTYGLVFNYINTVNSDVWLGAQPHTMRILSIEPDVKHSDHVPGGFYSRVTYTFSWNPMTDWRIRFLNQGYRELVAGERKIIFDDTGTPVNNAVPLTVAGAKLPVGGVPNYRGPYNSYRAVPFQPLNLP